MSRDKKILFLGFSCTELGDGYTKYLGPELTSRVEGLSTLRCGLGGLTPPMVPSTLKSIHKNEPDISHVLFEISTSLYAWNSDTTTEEATDIVVDLIYYCKLHKIKPFFLILYRKSLKSPVIDLNGVIKSCCKAQNVDYLDLSDEFFARYDADFVESLFRDVVHTNMRGARLFTDLSAPYIVKWLLETCKDTETSMVPKYERVALPICELIDRNPSGFFKRRDYVRPYLEISETELCHIKFAHPTNISALTFVLGPSSANFKICFSENGENWVQVRGFDKRCYYERLGSRPINFYTGRTVSNILIRFNDRGENISLLKGERAAFPAKIKLVDIISRKPTEYEAALGDRSD